MRGVYCMREIAYEDVVKAVRDIILHAVPICRRTPMMR